MLQAVQRPAGFAPARTARPHLWVVSITTSWEQARITEHRVMVRTLADLPAGDEPDLVPDGSQLERLETITAVRLMALPQAQRAAHADQFTALMRYARMPDPEAALAQWLAGEYVHSAAAGAAGIKESMQ